MFVSASAQKMATPITLPNGWKLSPAGKSFGLGDLPLNMALSKSGKYLAVTNNGQSTQSIQLIDVKAEKGAYFINSTLTLSSNESKQWMIVANVNQNHSQIVKLSKSIVTDSNLCEKVRYDVKVGTERLITLNSSADGVQLSGDKFRDSRHFSNTLFNIMRGGIFDKNYQIEKNDFKRYIGKANKKVARNNEQLLEGLNETLETLNQLIGTVVVNSENIVSASAQIAAAATELSAGATNQASSVEEISSSMEEMTANIQQTSSNSKQTERISVQAAKDTIAKYGDED